VDLNGEVVLPAPPTNVYQVLTDPEGLLKTMPGLKSLTPDGPNRYRAVLEVGVAAVRGRYSGVMEITEADPPHHYRLKMNGQGPGAFVTIDMTVDIVDAPEKPGSSLLRHQGTAQVGGTMAGVGQRVMGGVASMILSQFFQAVGREAAKTV
jgi:carbon monoxide dehydrogenase subunit G